MFGCALAACVGSDDDDPSARDAALGGAAMNPVVTGSSGDGSTAGSNGGALGGGTASGGGAPNDAGRAAASGDATAAARGNDDAGARDGGRPTGQLDAGMDSGGAAPSDAGRDARADSAAPSEPGNSGNPAYPPISNGCQGWSSRYWDCCKPHCGWTGNVSGSAPLASCSQTDQNIGANDSAMSSCQGGPAYMCQALAPWAVNANLSYGFAAISANGDICGKCYQLQFSGRSHNAGDDPGSAALAGKTMVVQATNVGGDVGSGQFDLLIPGGGVGKYNACSMQWGVNSSELGVQYGGFLASCKQGGAGDLAAIKSCVMQRCTSVFGSRGLSELEAGCRWFVDWFQAADNPALVYKEVPCPQELKGRGMNRNASGSNACGV
jgi:hypothetical protein